MYGCGPSSFRSLLSLPTRLPTTPLGASQTYSYPRVLCHPSGVPGAPPALLRCFLLRRLAVCTQGPATQLVPPGWASSSSTFHRRVRASRPGPLRFVSVPRSAFGKVPDASALGHVGHSPYPDVSGGIRLLCDSVRTSDAQHGLYRCRALQHSAFSYDQVPDHGHLHRGGERGDSSDSGVPLGTRDRGEDSGATSNSVGV